MKHIAYVFPGQGSQSIGMLAELAGQYPIIKDIFALVSERLGYDVWQLTQEGPETKLNQTEYTQVVMLTADVAMYKLLQRQGLTTPQFMAGHSLGEYAALVCAEALDLADAAWLVAKRGQAMQEAVPVGLGAMAAIVGLTDEDVQAICLEASDEENVVIPANFNAPGQVVIAGNVKAVQRALQLAEEKGARLAKIIPVSVPCHCPLLTEAAQHFAEFLALTNFNKPITSVISNVDLSIYQSAEQMRTLLKEQLFKPVRWVETIQLLASNHVDLIIECGPGKVLSGLIKRIDKSITNLNVNDIATFKQTVDCFANLEKMKEF